MSGKFYSFDSGHHPDGSLCYMARFRSALRFAAVFLTIVRHHFAALMRKKGRELRISPSSFSINSLLSFTQNDLFIKNHQKLFSCIRLICIFLLLLTCHSNTAAGQNRITKQQFEEKQEHLKFDKTKNIYLPRPFESDRDSSADDLFSRNRESEGSLTETFNILGYVIIGGIILVVILLVIKDSIRSKEITHPEDHDPLQDTENLEELDLTTMHANALGAQDYRLALRLLFLKALKLLSSKDQLNWQPHKTNRTYIHEIKNAGYKRSFRQLVSIFEYTWYGIAQVDAQLYGNLEPRFSSFINTLTNED